MNRLIIRKRAHATQRVQITAELIPDDFSLTEIFLITIVVFDPQVGAADNARGHQSYTVSDTDKAMQQQDLSLYLDVDMTTVPIKSPCPGKCFWIRLPI